MATNSKGWNGSDLLKVVGIGAAVMVVMAILGSQDNQEPAVTTNPVANTPSAPSTPPVSLPPPPASSGEDCHTANCDGHQAGYEWARDRDISDEWDCDKAGETSNSPSFAAGCRMYVDDGKYDKDTDEDSTPAQDQDPPQ